MPAPAPREPLIASLLGGYNINMPSGGTIVMIRIMVLNKRTRICSGGLISLTVAYSNSSGLYISIRAEDDQSLDYK